MLLFLVLFTLACVCACLWLMVQHHRFVKTSGGIPDLPGYLPIIGHGHNFLRADGEYLWQVLSGKTRETMALGGISTIWLGPVPFCAITDPEDALYLSNVCLDKPYFYGFGERWAGDGLVTTLNVATWKRHRKILKHAFSQKALDAFLGVFNQQAGRLVNDLASKVGGGEFDHADIITRSSLETVCLTALGLPSEDKHMVGNDYAFACEKMSEIVANRLATIWNHLDCFYKYSKGYRDEIKVLEIVHALSEKVLQKTKAETNNGTLFAEKFTGKERFKAFINLLLDDTEGSLTDKEIKNEIDTFIMAGFDTTAKTLIAILIVLGSYKNVQNKIYEEIKEVFGDSKRDVTKDDLQKLVYLDAAIKECLRLYPVVPFIARQAACDTKVRSYTIPSGTGIILCLWAVNRSPCWGPDAEEFKPDRWLGAGKLAEGAAGLATFALGKRNCIGKYYAQMYMKTILVHLLREYRFTGDHTKIKLKAEVVMRIIEGNLITIDRR